ncbi:hypothetical protein BJY04DRAFT_184299 [Aspergillus karnatakaensis]|uniref:uncharacterized protein n=1 Tax=Aspergillus karnatakaensis TaxID=1810916 RepID=UPI003CCD3584
MYARRIFSISAYPCLLAPALDWPTHLAAPHDIESSVLPPLYLRCSSPWARELRVSSRAPSAPSESGPSCRQRS